MEKDKWESLSKLISSFSINLLGTLFIVLIIAYFTMKALGNAKVVIPVQNINVEVVYPELKLPIDLSTVRLVVFLLFGSLILGIPAPVIPEDLKVLKVILSLVQAGIFIYGVYLFIGIILGLVNALM